MKNAQAKLDALLDALVDRLHARILDAPTEGDLVDLERLITLSNLNNARQEKIGKLPGPQSKAAKDHDAISDAALLDQLKATRDPDNFPRRGPRNGKRENVSTPAPVLEQVLCAIHEIPCVLNDVGGWTCPSCFAEAPKTEGAMSLKALL